MIKKTFQIIKNKLVFNNQKEAITFRRYLAFENQIKAAEAQGVVFILGRNRGQIILGVGFIGLGIATLPIPCGSIFMISFGCWLLGIGTSDLFLLKEELIRRIKNKFR